MVRGQLQNSDGVTRQSMVFLIFLIKVQILFFVLHMVVRVCHDKLKGQRNKMHTKVN